jgi:U3 small nucleolar RNA-associated protein 20
LARDLQEHFYPYFSKVLLVIVELLDPTDPELLGDAFSALSYLFKFLQKELLADLKNVFAYYKQLLGHRLEHIQRFAAESFAFLVRKLDPSQFSQFVDYMLEQCKASEPKLAEGIGHLSFEVIKA